MPKTYTAKSAHSAALGFGTKSGQTLLKWWARHVSDVGKSLKLSHNATGASSCHSSNPTFGDVMRVRGSGLPGLRQSSERNSLLCCGSCSWES
eukprot:1611713-Amphidinium_carterae.1